MNVLGISSLDTDSTVALVVDGVPVCGLAEERLSRVKMHAGFPWKALERVLSESGLRPEQIDAVTYPFYPWYREAAYMAAGALRNLPHALLAREPLLDRAWHWAYYTRWLRDAVRDHYRFNRELTGGLRAMGFDPSRLRRIEHHAAHAASAFYTADFPRALVVTLDAYGSGLAGSVSVGDGRGLRRLQNLWFPNSFGIFYAQVTEALGFKPTRHEGKIVGLAAFGDPAELAAAVDARFVGREADPQYATGMNMRAARALAKRHSREAVAAAYQRVLEDRAVRMVRHYLRATGLRHLVLAGGVTANVKLNQRLHEIPEVEGIFIHPNMADGGTAMGGALAFSARQLPGLRPRLVPHVFFGPEYTDGQILAALRDAGLPWTRPQDLELEVARLLARGRIVARFHGRMEYGPRALGNRSILYEALDPKVNDWLNTRLGRTEFMPFAPITLREMAATCFQDLAGAEHAAAFMTITFDCTPYMKETSPAAVHVDGTARPQLVGAEATPGLHRILTEYRRLTGIPSCINTSFNMHEEPIVCSPQDAIRAFTLGHLDCLAIGNFLVTNPGAEERARPAHAEALLESRR